MPKRLYARTDIPRELRMVNHYDVLSILLQWMERRRRDIELLLQKELYILRRMWYPRVRVRLTDGGLLPGGHRDFSYDSLREELGFMRDTLSGGAYYAPGY